MMGNGGAAKIEEAAFSRSAGQPSAGRWQSVASDMQAIFGPGDAMPHRARAPHVAGTRPRTTRQRRILAPLVLLTAVAGAVAGLVVVSPLHERQAAKLSMPARHVPSPAAPSTPTAMAVTPALAMSSAAPVWRRGAVPRPLSSARPFDAEEQPVPVSPALATAAMRPQEEARIGCDDGDDAGYAACARSDVIAADRELRSAYVRAVDAGVDRGRLVSIRNRWARLRATDYDRPGALLADYAELADRLDRAVDDAGGDLR